MDHSITFNFFVIFTGSAILATLAMFGRQPLLIAYIVLGALLGPYGFATIDDPSLISDLAHIGIVFLLYLLGLDMQPAKLITMLRKATLIALFSSAIFAFAGFSFASLFGYSDIESLVIGLAMMFSSTIIGIKLLPTTALHHKHIGELVTGLLLLQDLIAILVLIAIQSLSNQAGTQGIDWWMMIQPLVMLPLLIIVAWALIKWLIIPLLVKFDRIQEFMFLITIGWCLGLAELASFIGLSQEIGAFVAGVTMALTPIAQFVALTLKPLRDFFLVLFFFSLGASFNLGLLPQVWLPAIILAAIFLILKPLVFRFLLFKLEESPRMGWEVGFRLGQNSEFALLVAFLALGTGMIGVEAAHVIQATAIITFLISTYIVISRYPSPIAMTDKLRRD
ncbi:cation:proton antiporter [Litoribrevibacter albus]|uniref:Sodium:hydrogen antiporter n=1 Tax=Litoribrevibacter albus TaxID=1473156 RepID=A0AA37W792_9GAMM|nr:cation:proton antiporter [Litoribrevibacter albus]GLQ32260.1 sodium:hydrogen antiporter [Litoribrevibacter albus]